MPKRKKSPESNVKATPPRRDMPEPPPDSPGGRLLAAIRALDWSQYRASAEIGVSQPSVWRWIYNILPAPTPVIDYVEKAALKYTEFRAFLETERPGGREKRERKPRPSPVGPGGKKGSKQKPPA